LFKDAVTAPADLISTDFAALAFEIVISLPGRALKFSKSNLPAAELTFCKSIVPIALMVILPVTKAASLTVTVPFETKLRLSLACSAFNVIPLL
jgi:hydrogenase/urease accessory protein HupE